MPADDVQIAASAPAQLPLATPPFPLAAARAEVHTQIAPLPPSDPGAARQLALYAQNAVAAPEKTAEPARALPDIVYKGVAGKVLDALPIEPSTRVALQRANSIVSGAFTARALGALTGFGGPLLTVAGMIWGIFSSRQIEAAPATEAKAVPEPNARIEALFRQGLGRGPSAAEAVVILISRLAGRPCASKMETCGPRITTTSPA